MSHRVADAFHKGVASADNTTIMSGPWVLNVLAACDKVIWWLPTSASLLLAQAGGAPVSTQRRYWYTNRVCAVVVLRPNLFSYKPLATYTFA